MALLKAKLTRDFVIALLLVAAVAPLGAQSLDQLAVRGTVIANADPLSAELRRRTSEGPGRRGFDIGMAAAEGNTEPGPGKQRIHDSLSPAEQPGYDVAVAFSLQRNRNAALAATGARIASADPVVAQARTADRDVFYWLGFDIASGLFGDPARGAAGNTLMGPGSQRIRDGLNAAGQRGFTASVALHVSRNYRHSAALNIGVLPSTQVVPSATTNAQADRHVLLPGPATQVAPYSPGNARDRLCPQSVALRRPDSPSIAAVWQPLNEELHVFAIDAHGILKDVWKHHNGYWEPSFNLSAPGLAPAGAPLAAVWQPLNEQLEVFTIAPNGALEVVWKAHNGRWAAPIYITPPNFAPPSAHIAAIFQPLNNTLEVFAVDATGAVRVVWKAQNGAWQRPVALTPPGSAPAGAPLAAVWQPLNEQLEVFWIDTTGAAREVLKQHNGPWQQARSLTAAGFAGAGAEVAAVWQPLNEQLEVFAVDHCGAIKNVWKAHNSAWQQPVVIYAAGEAPAGAALIASSDPQFDGLQVIAVGLNGHVMRAYKRQNKPWLPGPSGTTGALAPEGTAPAGAPLTAVHTNKKLEVFTLDANRAVRTLADNGGYTQAPSITRANFGPIYAAHAAACTRYFKAWSYGDDLHQSQVDECVEFMGIKAHCDKLDAFVSVGHPPQDETPKFLQCSSRSHPEDVLDQVIHIGNGVAEGLVTAAPFVALALQAYACADGVLFACGTIAVDLAGRAGAIPAEVQVAYNLVNAAQQCSNGDVISCAKLGSAGAKAAGVSIPGEEVGQIALITQQCANDDFGACLRLGEKAADAAGVPIEAFNQAAKNARNCYDGDGEACIALGRQAADADVPVGGLVDGAENLRECAESPGRNLTDCQQLGLALAATAR